MIQVMGKIRKAIFSRAKSRNRICITITVGLILTTLSVYHSGDHNKEDVQRCPSFYILDNNNLSYGHLGSGYIDCGAIFRHQFDEVQKANTLHGCTIANDEKSILQRTKNCSVYLSTHSLSGRTVVSEKEKQFPVAFSILAYENVVQLEMLLAAIYRPQNIYCVHIDAKAPQQIHLVVKAIAGCYDNIIVAKSVRVMWGHISTLQAEMLCLRLLWNSTTRWQYWINLTGRDFPIKTNSEIVDILKVLNGSNDIQGSVICPLEWTSHAWKPRWSAEHQAIVMTMTDVRKGLAPLNVTLYKGSAHVIASRAFVNYVLHDPRAQILFNWLNDVKVPDEHFYNTLNYNKHLSVPGGVSDPLHGSGETITRYKIWKGSGSPCYGRILRGICSMGSGDLSGAVASPALFANKFHLEWEAVTLTCLQLWHKVKTEEPQKSRLNMSYYRNLPYLKYKTL